MTRHGTCYCGKVSITVKGPPKACSICHCGICRSLTGAPFSVQSLHAQCDMDCNTPEADLWALSTSKQVTRFRCKECASPIYASLGKNGKMVAVARSILFRRGGMEEDHKPPANGEVDESVQDATIQKAYIETFQPAHHMYYADRTMNVLDDLPKYVGTSTPGKGVLWKPSK
eukprot:scaffold1068_cov167-Amphora_coffeaeformis.AAC.41